MSRYIENAKEFMANYRQIRNYLDKKDIIKDSKILSYTNKLNDNNEIVEEIKNWCSKVGSYFLAAPTGSGKTYTLTKILKECIKNNENSDTIVVAAMVEPTVVLSEQASNLYDLQAIVAGEHEIDINRVGACVYDKIDLYVELKEELEKKGKNVRFVLCIDETHSLIDDQFRALALLKIDKVVKKLQGQLSVIYTTATFDNCFPLDVEHYLFANPTHEFSVGQIIEYKPYEGIDFNNYINSILIRELEKENRPKFCIRINSINTIKSIEYELTQRGYKVEILTAEDKKTKVVSEEYVENGVTKIKKRSEYVNPVYASILQGIIPSDIDVLLVTCLLDEGVSFNRLSDGSQPKDIIPCFVYDHKNYNLLDYKQFVARFRFELDTSFLFVERREEIIQEEIELIDIVKFYKDDYYNDYLSFKLSLNASQKRHGDNIEKIEREMKFLLSEITVDGKDGNNLNETIVYDDGEIIFNINRYFNNMYKKYMEQFITNGLARRAKIEKMFACEVVVDDEKLEEVHELAKYTDVVVDTTIQKLEEIKDLSDEEIKEKSKKECEHIFFSKKEYVNYLINDMNKKCECARGRDLTNLCRNISDIHEVLDIVHTCKDEEIKGIIHSHIQSNLANLSDQEKAELRCWLRDGMAIESYALKSVMDSSYKELLKRAYDFGLSFETIFKVAGERSISEFRYYLKEVQAIVNNKIIMGDNSYKGAGIAFKEQEVLVSCITNMRKNSKTFVISDNVIETLIERLKNATNKEWTKVGVKKFIKLVYSYNEREFTTKGKKSKVLTIKDLRKQHKSSN